MSTDPDARVRFQLAPTLGVLEDERAFEPLLRIARRDGGDRWTRIAVLSSAADLAHRLFAALVRGEQFLPRAAGERDAFLRTLATMAGARHESRELTELLRSIAATGPEVKRWQLAALGGLAEGLAQAGHPLRNELAGPGQSKEAARLVMPLVEAAAARGVAESLATGERGE